MLTSLFSPYSTVMLNIHLCSSCIQWVPVHYF